ncbi:malonyl CoA-acyl carrier protein transacylase [Paenibacillus sp. JCM 10914]|nr:malonyl CoA-acyl carrier protein transacylase [Paenibacillus sp. JCM 10914]
MRQVKDPVLILTGRSVLSAQTEVRLRELRSRGARIEYLQADVTRKEQAEHLVLYIVEEFGNLNGIIHSAGVIRDSFILKKNRQEIQQVLDPKVSGLVNLDLASREMPLEFFVFFSSIAGSFGNPGQADYAAANAFMDAYAVHRNDLAASGLRQGRTLSIGWPLWKDGGMGIDPHAEGRMMHSWGMKPLETETGIQAMYQALASGHGQVLIMSGEATKIREKVLSGSAPKQAISETADRSQVDQERLRDRTGQQFKALFGEITQLDATKININEPLEHYGIDSIMINQLNMKMEGLFGELSKRYFTSIRP